MSTNGVIPNTTGTKLLFNVRVFDDGEIIYEDFTIIGWKPAKSGLYVPVCFGEADDLCVDYELYVSRSWIRQEQFNGSHKMRLYSPEGYHGDPSFNNESECIEDAKRLAASHFKKVNA